MFEEREFDRSTILGRLADTRAKGDPILGVSAGVGIVAKCAEAAGVDFVSVQATGLSRHLGVPTTTTLGNATRLTLDAFSEIDNVVERTPIVGGIEATDGTRRRIARTLDEYVERGFDGISNFPTIGTMLTWAEVRKSVGEGIDREFELIQLAHDRDLFTVAHAYTPEHARELASSGADVVVARCGPTVGGFVGPARGSVTLEFGIERVAAILEAVRGANPGTHVIVHGGPFATPEDVSVLFAQTDAEGILGESAIERLPIEEYVCAEVIALKRQPMRTSE